MGFEPRKYPFPVDRVDIQRRCAADRLEFLRIGVAEHLDESRISSYQHTVAGRDVNTVDHVFEEPAIAQFRVLQPIFIALTLYCDSGQPGEPPYVDEFVRTG